MPAHKQRLATCLACFIALHSLQPGAASQDHSAAHAAAAGSSLADIGSADSKGARKLAALVTLYCNVTGSCKPCKVQHLQTDACKLTGQAEKLSCVTDGQSTHWTVLHLHRQIDTTKQPLHVSRSCSLPSSAAAKAAEEAAAVGATGSSSSGSEQQPHPRQVYYAGPGLTGVGGLNVLYFELAMLAVLSGALPVVYIRKRRYVRL